MPVTNFFYSVTIFLSLATVSVANASSNNDAFATMPSSEKEGFPKQYMMSHTHSIDAKLFASMPTNEKEGFPQQEKMPHCKPCMQHTASHDNFMSGSGPNGHVMNGELK